MKLRVPAVVVAALCFAAVAWAQSPYVVAPFQPTSDGGSSIASQFTRVGDAIYFYAAPDYSSAAIWKWTEAAGAQRVKTVIRDYYSSPVYLLAFGDKLLFAAQVDSRGTELWITDGTTTTLLKDIYAGGSSTPVPMIVSGSKAYFTAYDPQNGRELWMTDGTEAGTTLVADLTGNSDSSYPTAFAESNGQVYFSALNQLWVSDGTQAGTIALASGVSGTRAGVLNGQVFFLGSDNDHGRELWSTDGTLAGTALVKDINAGTGSSWGGIPSSFVQVGSSLLFFAEDAAAGRELWSTDGTASGTQIVKDITPGMGSTSLDSLVASASGAFFLVDNAALWFSDGSEAGTIAIGSYSRVMSMVAATNGAYFVTNEPSLMFSDGTAGGTIEITNVTPASSPNLTPDAAKVIFNGTDGTSGFDPWLTDGTEAGTSLLLDVGASGYSYLPQWMVAGGSNVYFRLNEKLWRSDGTAVGTFVLGDVQTPYYSYATLPNGTLDSTFLYFGGTTGSFGLWKTDGTVAGTSQVKPFSNINRIFAGSGGYALVVASESNSYGAFKLWRTDGTPAGTIALTSAESAYTSSAQPFVDLAGRTYFLTGYEYSDRWRELWTSEGTPETTRLVVKGSFGWLTTAGGALYVSQYTADSGRELWKSDGTADGFVLVKNIAPGSESSDPSGFVAAGNLLFFVADDRVHGRELWRTDGTEAGTFMVKDIRAGAASSNASGPIAAGGYVYFFAGDDTYGTELWRTDGTAVGTIRLTDSSYTYPYGATTMFDAKALFSGNDSFRGTELWESDGSVAGTFVAFDLIAGPSSSSPQFLTLTRDLLFFATSDANLWALPRAATRVSIDDRRVTEGNSGSSVLQLTVERNGDTSGASSVQYSTEDVTATAGVDYAAASGTISFAAGETTKTISVTILGDTVIEQNESFAVTLTSATGATIVRERAFGIIEENDRKVALSIQFIPRYTYDYNGRRTFRIANAGPSGATVTLKVSESPFNGGFQCDNKNPSICPVGFVPAGGSVDFDVYRPFSGLTETGIIPGRTLTATVSAAEPEADLTDNTIARMTNSSGYLSLPLYLIAGATATAQASAPNGYYPATLQPSVSGGVIVSPATATVTEANPVATFSMTVAPNAWGWSTVKNGTTTLMRIPIVLEGQTPKLDTAIVATTNEYSSFSFDHDEPVVIPVRVAATLHDGTRPSGTVALKNADGSQIQAIAVDAEGNATFNLSSVAVGTYSYRVTYGGDENFNAVTVVLPTVYVHGWSTYTDAVIISQPCGDSEIVATVTNGEDHTPTGSVTFTLNSYVIATVPLVATGTPGVAQATVDYSFDTTNASVYAVYEADSPFQASTDWAWYSAAACPAATVIASASSPTSVSLIWSDVGATEYAIVRSEAPSPAVFGTVGTTTGTTFVDLTALAGKAYLYRIQAKNAAGAIRSTSAPDLATTILFTNDPIVAKQTPIKAQHITELQVAANAVRALAGLSAASFAPVNSLSPINAGGITTIRTAIDQAYAALQFPGIVWTEGVASGKPVKAIHVQQLRNMVK